MKKYDIITALDLCVDFIVNCANVVPAFGQTEQIIENYHLALGGSSVIFACQAAKLGLKVAGVGSVGNDRFGEFILEQLKNSGVDISMIQVDQDIKTGMGLALTKNDGDRAILTYPGSIDGVEYKHFSSELVSSARHIHIGSYYLLHKIRPHYPDILKTAKALGTTVSLDTNWDPGGVWDSGVMQIMKYVDIFLPNVNEVCYISKVDSVDKAVEYMKHQVALLVVKKGKEGAEVFWGKESRRQPAAAANVIDTVGAGDNFDAGFVYGFLKGYDIDTCLKIGCIVGSKSTEMPGGTAGQIHIKQLEEIL